MYICVSMLALKWLRTESQMHMNMFYTCFLCQLSFHSPESSLFFICPLHLQYYLLFLKQPPHCLPTKLRELGPSLAVGILWQLLQEQPVCEWYFEPGIPCHCDSMRHYFLMQTHSDLRCTQYIKHVMYAKMIPIREEVNKFVMILMICILNVTSAEQLGSEGSDLCSVPQLSWGMVLLHAFITALQ